MTKIQEIWTFRHLIPTLKVINKMMKKEKIVWHISRDRRKGEISIFKIATDLVVKKIAYRF